MNLAPLAGRETELSLTPANKRKDVIVIGGGPAGLEAARVAALLGHRVRLFEHNGLLGGALVIASTVHPENESFLAWLLHEIKRSGVEVQLDTELDAAAIAALGPDAVVVASVGRLVTPRIDGDRLPHVLSGRVLRELVAGRVPEEASQLPVWIRWGARSLAPLQCYLRPDRIRRLSRLGLPIGRRVAILGADLAAVELAEFLAERGRRVALLDGGDVIAPEVGGKRRAEHMDRLDRLAVSVNLGVTIESIRVKGVAIARPGAEASVVAADNVIIAGEVVKDTTLFDTLEGRVPECYAVGDCTELGLIQKAIVEGARAGCSI